MTIVFKTLLFTAAFVTASQLAPEEIIRQSVAANEKDWSQAPAFSHRDRTIETKGGETSDRTYQVTMIAGSPYRRLIAINGQPLNDEQRIKEEEKERHEIAGRDSETPAERDSRLRKYEKDRDQDRLLMTQMAAAFKFALIGEDTIYGHPVYVLSAEPRPDYKAPNRQAKVLMGMRGRLWVEKDHFHWVKVEAEVIHPVTFGGFLAKVGPGTKFELEKEPVGGEIWQPKEFTVQVCASVLFWSHNSRTKDQFSDYRRQSTAAASTAASGLSGLSR